MPRFNTLTVAILFVTLSATGHLAWGQTKHLLPAADGFTNEPTFLTLIDDWVARSGDVPREMTHGPTEMGWSFAKRTGFQKPVSRQFQQALREADAIVASLPTVESGSYDPSGTPETSPFNQQMALLLSITLNSPGVDTATRIRAIEASMNLVAEHSALAAKAKIAELQSEHSRTIAAMRNYVLQVAKRETARPLVTWMQVPKQRAAESGVIESRMRAKEETAKRKLAEYRASRNLEANRLREEIKRLDQRIESLMASPVRPAYHLEPMYTPDVPLEPMAIPRQR